MDKIKIDVEMIFSVDKSVYTAPNFEWFMPNGNHNPQTIKTIENFFDYHIIEYIAADYAIFKREANRTPDNVQSYKGIITVLENIIPEIRKSIEYKIISENNNLQTVKANFNYNHYQLGNKNERTPQQLFETLVMIAGVNRYKSNIKITKQSLERAMQAKQNINLELITDKIKQWEYVVSFFENIKYVVSPSLDNQENIQPQKKYKI